MTIEQKLIRAVAQDLLPTLVNHFLLGITPGGTTSDGLATLAERCTTYLEEKRTIFSLREELKGAVSVLEGLVNVLTRLEP